MPDEPASSPQPTPPAPTSAAPPRTEGMGAIPCAIIALVVLGLPAWFAVRWVFFRLEVPAAYVAVVINKTGDDLLAGEIIAARPDQKGIQLATLPAGRHFMNPLFYETELRPILNVPNGQIGVLTRLYGATPDLTQDLLVPLDSDLKGIVAEVLAPGQYPLINPMAYDVVLEPAVTIEAGFVGVKCNRVGKVPVTVNSYLVEAGERGVQKEVLKPGVHYLNPHAVTVYPVDVRSQRLELSMEMGQGAKEQTIDGPKQQALVFPSSDGFEIEVKLTCEWSIDEERAAEVFVRIGTNEGGGDPMGEILHKILIPALRGNARIEGSKYPAANYIAGDSRTIFQQSIFESLKSACGDQGIIIRSVLVNDIVPPQVIATPIRDREVAKEELARNAVQLQQAKAEQSLARETELINQQDVKVKSETEKSTRTIEAEGQQRIALIEQERALSVAKADLSAAELQAGAIIARGRAEADVILAQNVAESESLRASVAAFASPGGFAAYTFATRIGPRIHTVFADPDGPFGTPFKDLLAPQAQGERR